MITEFVVSLTHIDSRYSRFFAYGLYLAKHCRPIFPRFCCETTQAEKKTSKRGITLLRKLSYPQLKAVFHQCAILPLNGNLNQSWNYVRYLTILDGYDTYLSKSSEYVWRWSWIPFVVDYLHFCTQGYSGLYHPRPPRWPVKIDLWRTCYADEAYHTWMFRKTLSEGFSIFLSLNRISLWSRSFPYICNMWVNYAIMCSYTHLLLSWAKLDFRKPMALSTVKWPNDQRNRLLLSSSNGFQLEKELEATV